MSKYAIPLYGVGSFALGWAIGVFFGWSWLC
jgi:hypothetical protein